MRHITQEFLGQTEFPQKRIKENHGNVFHPKRAPSIAWDSSELLGCFERDVSHKSKNGVSKNLGP